MKIVIKMNFKVKEEEVFYLFEEKKLEKIRKKNGLFENKSCTIDQWC